MLTKEAIEYLFNFCNAKGVLYYDVQVELVDHLANAVELEMQNDSKLTFENAVEKVYRNFGYRGFELLVVEKQKMLKKQNLKIYLDFLKVQFQWPKMLLFVILTFTLFTVFSIVPPIIKPGYFFVMTIGVLGIMINELYIKTIIAKTGYKFLAWNFNVLTRPFNYTLLLPGLFGLYTGKSLFLLLQSRILIPEMSILLSLYIVGIIVMFQTMFSVKKIMYKTFPQVFQLQNKHES